MRAVVLSLGAAASAALAILAAPACNIVAGLDPLEITSCTSMTDCDDGNACTVDACGADGACTTTPAPEGDGPSQITGDCKRITCSGGAAAEVSDDLDLPTDNESCTIEGCSGGQATFTPLANGAACKVGTASGACTGGVCNVACGPAKPCDDDNPCTNDTCTAGVCSFTTLDQVPTPGAMDVPGDCQKPRCVAGADTQVPDDADAPAPATDCVDASCSAGKPVSTPHAMGSACATSGGKVCDAVGACVACVADTDCPGTTDDCQHPLCKPDAACGTAFTASGTKTAMQMAGDCHVNQCDGSGGVTSLVDDTDAPPDGNECTKDLCTAGVSSHPNEAAGTVCGMGQACNAVGQCGCANDAQCTAPNTCGGGNPGVAFTCGCTKKTCGQIGATCGIVTDGCFATQACDDAVKNGSETDVDCGGGGGCATKCALTKQCSVDGDCAGGHCADGVCCNTACAGTCTSCNLPGKVGTCSLVASGLPDQGTCTGNNACDGGGACKKLNGQVCSMNLECVSGQCADGYCCNTACIAICKACNLAGSLGACSNVPASLPDSMTCTGNNACDGGGTCKLAAGQVCVSNSQCASGNCNGSTCL